AVLAAFQVRGLGGPRLIRMPLGALPDLTALTYDSAASTLSAVDDAGAAARAPVSLALSIAVDGTRVVVGTENGVLLSEDGGRTLMPVLRDIHIWAVALSGADAAAVSWGRSLYVSHDGGRGWRPASAPRADLHINALLVTSAVGLAGPLGQTETVSVAVSGGTRFAATPGSRVWADAGDGWHQVLAGVRW